MQYDVVLYTITDKGELTPDKTLSDNWDSDLRPWEKPAATQK